MTTITIYHGTSSSDVNAGMHAGASWTTSLRSAAEYARGQRSNGGLVRILATVIESADVADIEFGRLGDDTARLVATVESGKAWGVADGDADPNGREHDVFVPAGNLDPAKVWVDHVMATPAGYGRAKWHELMTRLTGSVTDDLAKLDELLEDGELFADNLDTKAADL